MEEHFSYVGVRIISRLKELGLKQADLCRETGLSTTAISQYCTGKQVPNTAALYSLANALKTSMEWLLTGNYPSAECLTNKDSELPRSRFAVCCDGIPLAESEADLIAMYRLVPAPDKKTIMDITKLKYEQSTGEKASFFSTYTDTIEPPESAPSGGDKAAGKDA